MKRNFSLRKTKQGMTLLEVLVALAIFATAALSVLRSVTQHINTLGYLEEKTFAGIVVDNQMTLMMLDKPPTVTKKGETELAGRTWYWTVSPVKTTSDILKSVDVSVSTNKDQKSPLITVRTYVAP
ncbi:MULTISPECIES: type II secretion system minor pseudopilin GspI [Aliivibrio]|uniref:Type II secretion system protein I n=1 Tax=Aliivibrio finisterrensis TaxID=511998 RepID=A0A4Q5KSL2_9GAMM|nr:MULTISPECIES: type II secretion system minor pseudopilin GspI [Aliivibrio]MDD9176675.1 type II secretion system minor pseudopilin GspI [Aliivibrio sp. S3TY1]MDD9179794.1 type II secretion system minor pseudopilin GspI [Aliivibrio sp. A6]MDD9193753.1 type II secretion system minor pseudopilin GspI [Aliivibrio sp. S2TY2]RYU45350.1 type II secretion system protein GspI [Aliivibrio finisterrensis]RYU50413.1 type II secretion system protein GspI [Aliivibrio finisterrensis]